MGVLAVLRVGEGEAPDAVSASHPMRSPVACSRALACLRETLATARC